MKNNDILDCESRCTLRSEYQGESPEIIDLAEKLFLLSEQMMADVSAEGIGSFDISLPVFHAGNTVDLREQLIKRFKHLRDDLGYKNSESIFARPIEKVELCPLSSNNRTISDCLLSCFRKFHSFEMNSQQAETIAKQYEQKILEILNNRKYVLIEFEPSKFEPNCANKASFDIWSLFGIYGIFAGDISILMQIGSNE